MMYAQVDARRQTKAWFDARYTDGCQGGACVVIPAGPMAVAALGRQQGVWKDV